MRGFLGAVLILAMASKAQAQPYLVADLNTTGSGGLAEFHKVSAGLRFMDSRGYKWLFDGSEASYLPYSFSGSGINRGNAKIGNFVYAYDGSWVCYGKSECLPEYRTAEWNVETDDFLSDFAETNNYEECTAIGDTAIPWRGNTITDIGIGYINWGTWFSEFRCEQCVRLLGPDIEPSLPTAGYDAELCSYRSPHALAPFRDGVLFIAARSNLSRFDLWGGNIVNGSVVEACLTCDLAVSGAIEFYVWNDEIYFVGSRNSGRALYALFRPKEESETKSQSEGNFEGEAEGLVEGEGVSGGVNGTPVDWGSLSMRLVYPGDTSVNYSLGAFIDFDGVLFFCGSVPETGGELWISDGTTDGTRLHTDILPGTLGSSPAPIAVWNNALYFVAQNSSRIESLYRLSGRDASPELLAELRVSLRDLPIKSHEYDGKLCFQIGYQVFETDGTAGGTMLYSAAHPGADISGLNDLAEIATVPGTLVRTGGALKLVPPGGGAAETLIDLTSTADSSPQQFSVGNGVLLFTPNDTNPPLWVLRDMEVGPKRLKDKSTEFRSFKGGAVVQTMESFYVYDYEGEGEGWLGEKQQQEGETLPSQQNTKSGGYYVTSYALDFVNVLRTSIAPTSKLRYDFFEITGLVGFLPIDYYGTNGLLSTDCASADYRTLLPSLLEQTVGFSARFAGQRRLILSGQDRESLVVSDLTPLGTFQVPNADAIVGNYTRYDKAIVGCESELGVSYFNWSDTLGVEPWRSDGTQQGTFRLADLAVGPANSSPSKYVPHLGDVYFDGTIGTVAHLWRVQADAPEVEHLLDFSALGISKVTDMRAFGDYLYFKEQVGTNNPRALWRTDGSVAGTIKLGNGNPGYLTYYRGRLYYQVAGRLFSTDGTIEGTQEHAVQGLGSLSARIGNELVVQLNLPQSGREFGVVDLDTETLSYSLEVFPGLKGGLDETLEMVRQGGHVYFAAEDMQHGVEPWAYAGAPGLNKIELVSGATAPENLARFRVMFTSEVQQVDAADFGLVSTGRLGAQVISVLAEDPANYLVDVHVLPEHGRVRLTVSKDNDIATPDGKHLGGSGLGDEDYLFGDVAQVNFVGDQAAMEGEGTVEGEGEGSTEGVGEGEGSPDGEGDPTDPSFTSADYDKNGAIGLPELLRIIQFYNSGGLRCQADTEDGYAPGAGGDISCAPHDLDYDPQDWRIRLAELLRGIQFFNIGAYHYCPDANTEDGYCPGAKR